MNIAGAIIRSSLLVVLIHFLMTSLSVVCRVSIIKQKLFTLHKGCVSDRCYELPRVIIQAIGAELTNGEQKLWESIKMDRVRKSAAEEEHV